MCQPRQTSSHWCMRRHRPIVTEILTLCVEGGYIGRQMLVQACFSGSICTSVFRTISDFYFSVSNRSCCILRPGVCVFCKECCGLKGWPRGGGVLPSSPRPTQGLPSSFSGHHFLAQVAVHVAQANCRGSSLAVISIAYHGNKSTRKDYIVMAALKSDPSVMRLFL